MYPTLIYSAPRNPDLGIIGDYVAKLSTAGAIMPDDDLSDYLREIAGLPLEEAEDID